MIVDCHTHIFATEHWSEEFIRDSIRATGKPIGYDKPWSEHWQAMQVVDKAIVFGLRAKHTGIVVPNDFIAAYVNEHPEKLIGFASVDPNEQNYLDELRRAVEELKLRGLKLGPIYQNYAPMDERMQPVYEYCQRRRLPILIHQGTTFPRVAPLKFALPILLEDVAFAYPDLKIVIAHLGHPWIAETMVLIRKHPNLYADISALHYRPWQFYNALVMAMEYGVMGKLLFGTDYPFTTPEATIKDLREINRIPEGTGMPRLPEEAINGLIERDTLNLLGLQ
jgi:predicted TIM-barrel fold metal-dependent hydrolase